MDNDFILHNLVSTNYVNRFRTGNIIIDTFITMFVVSLFPYISIYGKVLFNYMRTHFYPDFSKKNSIVLEGCICKDRYDEYHYNFTDSSRAIFRYINKNIKNIEGLTKLIELTVKKDRLYDDETGNTNNKVSTNLIVNQNKELKLDDDIYVTVEVYDKTEEVSTKPATNGSSIYKNVIITLFSKEGTVFEVNNFLNKCVKEYDNYLINSMAKNQLYFIMNDDDKLSYTEYTFDSNTTFDTIFFSDKDKIISDIDFFENNRNFYKEKGLPRRYTLLLYGNHGSGKTSTIKCIANKTGRHIISINANLIKDKKMLEDIFYKEQIGKYTIPDDKKLYVIEEFDINNFNIVKDRNIDYTKNDTEKKGQDVDLGNKNSNTITIDKEQFMNTMLGSKYTGYDNNKSNVSLGDILQVLDGVKECEGRMLIITTNNIDKLDKALIRRGRINRQIQFGKPTITDMINIYKFYFGDKNVRRFEELLGKIDLETKSISPADLVSFCRENANSSNDFMESLERSFID